MIVAIDLMGSDCSPSSLLQATLSFIDLLPPNIQIIALGIPEYEVNHPRLLFHPVSEWITMEENPLIALRRKKKASICEGLRLLKEGRADAFVSAGSTGALVSAAKVILRTLPGCSKPALIGLIPTKKKPVAVLDIGAHLDARTPRIVQLATLGAAYQKARGITSPKVALLNIGTESIKGTPSLQTAYQTLIKAQNDSFQFVGNIEGSSVFQGDIDVLVTDGFTGNIFLKTAEGVANLIASPDALKKRIYPAALLAGVQKTVVKCHSYSSPEIFMNAIRTAIEYTVSQFNEKLRHLI